MRDEFDVAVVGCGPVGALAGLLSSQAGFTTLVIDQAREVYDLPRAIHFDAQIMRLFQQVGVDRDLEPRIKQWHRSVFTGADGQPLRVHEFPREPVEGWAPHYLFYQPELEQVLRRALRDEGTDLRLGAELVDLEPTEAGVEMAIRDPATGEIRTVKAAWVIGCDGASSTVRRRLGVELRDLEFDEPWLVVDANVDHHRSLPPDSRMVCDPQRPMTLIEGRGTHRRWEFMLLPGEDPSVAGRAPFVNSLLARWIDPAQIDVIRAAVYRFHALVAKEWRVGRVFLAGDAAHQTPPFLGQGMCHGMRDVSNLAWKLRAVEDGRASNRILDSYEQERSSHVEEIIALAVAGGRDICLLDPELAAARDRRIREAASRRSLPPSPFIGMPPLRTGLLGRGRGAGHLFPQPTVTGPEGQQRLDDIVGANVSVVVADARPEPLDPETLLRLADTTAVTVLVTSDPAASTPTPNVDRVPATSLRTVHDATGFIGRWMNTMECRVAVLRPDRYAYATTMDPGSAVDQLTNLESRLRTGQTQRAIEIRA